MDTRLTRYNTGDALLEALQESGVSFIFSNLGSDHPSIIEGLAKRKAEKKELLNVIIAPHEFVALSAAHGYYLVSGEAQGVFVHTDVGTQNLGGSVHNAARSRIPVFIFAGETPSTTEGELAGSRNSPINYIQNVYDQRGIVREYVKWDYDIRTGRNIKQLISRAMHLATSDPKGPVYLTGAREVLEEEIEQSGRKVSWSEIKSPVMSARDLEETVSILKNAKNPLIITSYLGRNKESVPQLVELSETFAIPVIESTPSYVNFPSDHPLHLGYMGGQLLKEADVILVIDSDVPWVYTLNRPGENCTIIHLDIDPLKESLPLWHYPVHSSYRVNSYEVLLQLNEYSKKVTLNENAIKERFAEMKKLHDQQRKEWKAKEQLSESGFITPEWLTQCLRNVVDEDTIILNETITNALTISQSLPRKKPGTLFTNGGTGLGWNGGAAIGAKLAQPDKLVVSLTGDGTFLFTVPSSVHWMSRRYNAPFLTVIYNNQGWNATKQNLLKLYPDGIANRDDQYYVNFDQPSDLSKIAEAAGGALAIRVSDPEKLQEALLKGVEAVKAGRSAVIDVILPQISNQKD